MKVHLVRFFIKIASVAVLVTGMFRPSTAHDMPIQALRYELLATNCMDSNQDSVRDRVRTAAPTRWPAELTSHYLMLDACGKSVLRLSNQFATSNALLRTFGHRLADWNSPAKGTAELLVHSPDAGKPPMPSLAPSIDSYASRSLAKGRVLEEYLPYDLPVRDWRFGQLGVCRELPDRTFPMKGFAPQRHAPTEPAIVLGELLGKANEFKLIIASALSSAEGFEVAMQASFRGLNQIFASTESSLALASEDLRQDIRQLNDQPYYSAPAFVIYEVAGGKQFVMTTEQAQHWQLVQPYRAKINKATKVKPKTLHISTKKTCPVWQRLQNSLAGIVVERAGKWQLDELDIAGWFANISNTQIATKSLNDLY